MRKVIIIILAIIMTIPSFALADLPSAKKVREANVDAGTMAMMARRKEVLESVERNIRQKMGSPNEVGTEIYFSVEAMDVLNYIEQKLEKKGYFIIKKNERYWLIYWDEKTYNEKLDEITKEAEREAEIARFLEKRPSREIKAKSDESDWDWTPFWIIIGTILLFSAVKNANDK